jgi:hypothetical protein
MAGEGELRPLPMAGLLSAAMTAWPGARSAEGVLAEADEGLGVLEV